jgi:hypothetical protein
VPTKHFILISPSLEFLQLTFLSLLFGIIVIFVVSRLYCLFQLCENALQNENQKIEHQQASFTKPRQQHFPQPSVKGDLNTAHSFEVPDSTRPLIGPVANISKFDGS